MPEQDTRNSTTQDEFRTGPNSGESSREATIDVLRREMQDAYILDDQLLDKFFPIDPAPDPRFEAARKKNFNYKRNRWKNISATPTPLSRIYKPLTNLLNAILFHSGIRRDERLFIDNHTRRPKSASYITVPVFLAGVGKEFVNSIEILPTAIANNAISVIEVVRDTDDMVAARDQLAAYMQDIFKAQDNRRFAFGLIMTPNEFTLYLFDHSGAVTSKPCNYHLNPDRFCAVISGLAAGGERIGCDRTIFLDNHDFNGKIFTFQTTNHTPSTETRYNLSTRIFRFSSLVGRGTICWGTSQEEDPESIFVIKDAWIPLSDPPGRESEASLLRYAQSRGMTTGICQIHYAEDVRRSDDPLDLDTVLRNRKVEDPSPEMLKLERVHTRIVMSSHGKTLDKFSSRKELLLAFHDAVLAHRKLYTIAGILHRDISYRNPLINPDGAEGDRGILIDFDHAIRIDNNSPYSKKPGIGTWRFRSRDCLAGRVPHTYFDDLESFYYVLCWIIGGFEKPNVLKRHLPSDLYFWDQHNSCDLKGGYIFGPFELPVSSYFGSSLVALAEHLHDFFSVRASDPSAHADPDTDYDEFIAHIRKCVVDLDKEEHNAAAKVINLPGDSEEEEGSAARKLKRGAFEDHEIPLAATPSVLDIEPSNPLPLIIPASYGRPRRSTANYSYPVRPRCIERK